MKIRIPKLVAKSGIVWPEPPLEKQILCSESCPFASSCDDSDYGYSISCNLDLSIEIKDKGHCGTMKPGPNCPGPGLYTLVLDKNNS